MSTSVNNAFITQYERDVHDVFQLNGSRMKPSVRFKSGVNGSSTTFQKIGKGTATTKARHGTITPMNQTHTAISCSLSDFYAGDWVDKLDEAKINIDERIAIARGGAMALGRKVDSQIFTTLDATSQSAVSITVSSFAAVKHGLVQMVGDTIRLDSYEPGRMYGVLSPVGWERAMSVDSFARAEYVGAEGMEYTKGAPTGGPRFKDWMGVKWMVHSANPGVGTATSKIFVWNQDAVGYAAGDVPANLAGTMSGESSVGADITWHGDRAAWFVNHAMSGGSAMIDDTGVIEGNMDDTAALATS